MKLSIFCKMSMASLAILGLAMTVGASTGHAESSAVASLIGSWAGSGHISFTDGRTENIHCNGYCTGGGSALKMAIQCKSDTNTIHIRSSLKIDGAHVSGEWEERTFNASGTASGSVGNGSMSIGLTGGGFAGSMSVSFSRSSQSVSISTQGIALSKVNIRLSRH